MSHISFTWSTRRDGNEGFVLEESSAGHKREYGPMPAHIVPAFVQGRRQIVSTMLEDVAEPVLDNFDYLTETSKTEGSA